MRKWLAIVAVVAVSFVSLEADVTVVQTMTLEGAAAAMKNGQMPRMTMRIKGQKSRTDIEVNGQTIISIADLASKQVIILNSSTKTAMVSTPESVAAGGEPVPLPKLEVTFKPTGKSQSIDGQQCDEHALALRLSMADMTGPGLPPEAAAMMKDVLMVMTGSIWVAAAAPGAPEYAAFNKAALSSNLIRTVTGMSGKMSGGFDKLMEAAASAPGLPYLTDITMAFEGSGPMVEAMKQVGPVRLIQKIASVSTDTIVDDMFAIPEGYTVEKK